MCNWPVFTHCGVIGTFAAHLQGQLIEEVKGSKQLGGNRQSIYISLCSMSRGIRETEPDCEQ